MPGTTEVIIVTAQQLPQQWFDTMTSCNTYIITLLTMWLANWSERGLTKNDNWRHVYRVQHNYLKPTVKKPNITPIVKFLILRLCPMCFIMDCLKGEIQHYTVTVIWRFKLLLSSLVPTINFSKKKQITYSHLQIQQNSFPCIIHFYQTFTYP